MSDERTPYREMDRADLDADARELDAVAAFGHWRMGVRARAITIACVVGAVLGGFGYVAAMEIQLASTHRASVLGNVAGFALPFALALVVGLAIARARIKTGAPAKVRELGERYDTDPAKLEQVAAMVDRL